jgi:hypothetical protein
MVPHAVLHFRPLHRFRTRAGYEHSPELLEYVHTRYMVYQTYQRTSDPTATYMASLNVGHIEDSAAGKHGRSYQHHPNLDLLIANHGHSGISLSFGSSLPGLGLFSDRCGPMSNIVQRDHLTKLSPVPYRFGKHEEKDL